jgi:hypothetical protein
VQRCGHGLLGRSLGCSLAGWLLGEENGRTPKDLQSAEAILPPVPLRFVFRAWIYVLHSVSYTFVGVYLRSTLIPATLSINVNIRPMSNIQGILQQLRAERDQLDRAINALSSVSRTGNGAHRVRARSAGRRFSAVSIAKMRAAQRARRVREKSRTVSAKKRESRVRRISPAGLARIRAAQRARWAKHRAAKKK